MANYDFLRQISVKVNDGSGVIVKPCTDEYCYVFTDWHVIEHLKKEEISVEYYVSEKMIMMRMFGISPKLHL